MALRHPIYNPLGLGNTANHMEVEYRAHPLARRLKWLKQWVRLKALLLLSGQLRRRVRHLPAGARKVLYAYDWGAIGDSIMDLSQRHLFPPEIRLDLYMPAKAAALFEGDARFCSVYRNAADCPADYDLIILHNISPALVKFKMQWYPETSFYDVLGFIQGELYARARFCHASLTRFLAIPAAPIYRPQLGTRHSQSVSVRPNSVLVSLGALDQERRHFKQWTVLLARIQAACFMMKRPLLTFVLTGLGPSARKDVDALPPQFVQDHCEVCLDLPDIPEVQAKVASCQYFLGPDGGLMHIAEAMDKQGVALFAGVAPDWRLTPMSRLRALSATHSVNDIAVALIAEQFMELLQNPDKP